MTDTDITATDSTSGAQQQNLSALRLPELRQIAQRMGIRGTSTLRKGALIEAIQSNGASLAKPARETASEAAEAVELLSLLRHPLDAAPPNESLR